MNGTTVILLNYQRPQNMARIIESIKMQTVPTEIILIDNSDSNTKFNDVDLLIKPSRNLGCYIRLLMAHYAKYDHIVFMDDDLCINNKNLFNEIDPTILTLIQGAWGRNLDFSSDKPYSGQPDKLNGLCNVIKGRFIWFVKTMLRRVPIGGGYHPYDPFNEDIYFSLSVNNVHVVQPFIRVSLDELEVGITGLQSDPTHYLKRDEFCRWWKEQHVS